MVEEINTLEGPLAALREAEVTLLTDVSDALVELGDDAAEDRARLLDVAKDLQELFFLVVIIGEFNAGKSTFVNALLEDELLPMGITPTTEVIELIRYNATTNRKPVMRGDSLREWAHPNTGAPGVAIVDTPGTGSVFQRHESTAKEFLHRSDLVVFLLSAKRAFAETERIYLEMAKNYGKKIILVLNQIDLLKPDEQTQVRRFIEQQVKEHLGLQPLLFMVSAKDSLASRGSTSPLGEAGGIDAVRAHLRGVFAEAPPAKQKLLSQLDSLAKVVDKYAQTIQKNAELIKADTVKVHEVEDELQQQSLGLDSQLSRARTEIDTVLTGMRQRGVSFIDTNLSIRKFGRPVKKDKLQADFQDVVIGRALRDINEATGDYINAVVDQSRLYWRSVIDRLNKLVELLEREVDGLDSNIYAEQREGLEEAIRIAEGELKVYSSGQLVEEIRQDFESNMSGFAWGAMAGVGGFVTVLLAVSAKGAILGIGGAASAPLISAAFIIAAPLAALGGITAVRHYRRITNDLKKDFDNRVDRLRATYYMALDDLTRKERKRLTQYGSQVLTPIFSRLEVLTKRYEEQKTRFESFNARTETLRKGVDEAEIE
jgi:small GTP-binding protein